MKGFIFVLVTSIFVTNTQGCGTSQVNSLNNEGKALVHITEINKNYIKADKYEGAILTTEEQSWIPDKKIIDEFETKLIPYINNLKSREGNTVYYEENSLLFVRENIEKYKRQYLGKIVDGVKILYCNFLLIDETKDTFKDWKTRYIVVCDGGPYFFQISYDINQKKLFDFYINGNA